MEEEVLVFPARILHDYDFEGFKAYKPQYRNLLSEIRSASSFVPRKEAEFDPTILQVIPYAYVYGWKPAVLVYERTTKGGESRLHSKWSVGVGGHINPVDNTGDDIFTVAAAREVNEEFVFTGSRARTALPTDFTLRGFIRRTDTTVNSVHFGVVYAFGAPTETAAPAAEDCTIVSWMRPQQLMLPESFERLEAWSQDVVTFLSR